jgi:hypothetical protein
MFWASSENRTRGRSEARVIILIEFPASLRTLSP